MEKVEGLSSELGPARRILSLEERRIWEMGDEGEEGRRS